jgi:hypothetical protein
MLADSISWAIAELEAINLSSAAGSPPLGFSGFLTNVFILVISDLGLIAGFFCITGLDALFEVELAGTFLAISSRESAAVLAGGCFCATGLFLITGLDSLCGVGFAATFLAITSRESAAVLAGGFFCATCLLPATFLGLVAGFFCITGFDALFEVGLTGSFLAITSLESAAVLAGGCFCATCLLPATFLGLVAGFFCITGFDSLFAAGFAGTFLTITNRESAAVLAGGRFCATGLFLSTFAIICLFCGWAAGAFLAVRTVLPVLTLAVFSIGVTIFLRTTLGFAGTSVVLSHPHKSRAIQIVLIKYRMITSYLPYHLLVDLC